MSTGSGRLKLRYRRMLSSLSVSNTGMLRLPSIMRSRKSMSAEPGRAMSLLSVSGATIAFVASAHISMRSRSWEASSRTIRLEM